MRRGSPRSSSGWGSAGRRATPTTAPIIIENLEQLAAKLESHTSYRAVVDLASVPGGVLNYPGIYGRGYGPRNRNVIPTVELHEADAVVVQAPRFRGGWPVIKKLARLDEPVPMRVSFALVKRPGWDLHNHYHGTTVYLYVCASSLIEAGLYKLSETQDRWTGFAHIERGLTLALDSVKPHEFDAFEKRWNKFQKLKALALAPGTQGESNAATESALRVVRAMIGGPAS